MKNLKIIALLCLLPSYILSISSSMNLDGKPIHTCNELVQAMVNQKDQVATAIRELFLNNSNPYQLLQRNTLTKAEKQAILEDLNRSLAALDPEATFNPCVQLQQIIQEHQTEFLPQVLQQIDKNCEDKSMASRFKEPVERLINDDTLAQDWSLVVPSHFNEVSSQESISYEKLTALITEQILRGLELLNIVLQLNYKEKPLMNALYAHEMLRTMINVNVGVSIQRWLEYDLSEQQWRQLLDTQYAAFARVVPSVCAIIDMFNQSQQNTIAA